MITQRRSFRGKRGAEAKRVTTTVGKSGMEGRSSALETERA